MSMNNNFSLIFLSLETKKTKVLNLINGLDNETLNLKSHLDKWSLAQILFHVIKGEQFALIAFLNSLKPGVNLKSVGLSASIKSILLNFSLKTNFKFKAPPIAKNVPDTVNTIDLLNKWEDVRKQINDVCLKIPDDKYNKGVFKHPFVGMINLKQTLKFLLFHLNHHLKQIEDLSILLKQK